MEIIINNAKLEEICNWINENCNEDELSEWFDVDELEDGKVTTKQIKDYIIGTMEGNLEYDFDFPFGLD